MTAPIIITGPANRDIEGHREWLSRSSRATARRFVLALRQTAEQLAGMPGLGSPWESDAEEFAGMRFRSVPGFRNHLIFYRPLTGEDGGIEVLRVLHAAQDLDAIFGEGSG